VSISKTSQWNKLKLHFEQSLKNIDMIELFSTPNRVELLTKEFDQLFVDYSKQKLEQKTINLLIELAEKVELRAAIEELVQGGKVNSTENRSALHTALRLQPNEKLFVDGIDINESIQDELSDMSRLIDDLTLGNWRGYSGKPITDIVNLGVGGSDLGPLLVCHALDEFKFDYLNKINIHFASTMDGSQVSQLFEKLNPETTVFVIVSKSFSTVDTLSNAASAKTWLLQHCNNSDLINKQHFIGISTTEKKMSQWGIHPDHQLMLWEWVGGRFSLWSSVGLTIALKIGMDNFREFLNGANALDKHFLTADFNENLPVILGLVGIWNTNFLKINAQAILPYDARLNFFPNYLTQLEMESNGKSVTHEGEKVDYETCPVLWGEVGPNAQHAFYQLLHQGTRNVACDFIAPIKRFSKNENAHQKSLFNQHLLTLANCFAQSRALMLGGSSGILEAESNDRLAVHKFYPGNQPSTTILVAELTPYSLGQLIALYEHKVFVMATIWDINPFDQWGVELGKNMAVETMKELKDDDFVSKFDSSSNGLINRVKKYIQESKK
jgi:glucose-6-phosphate isomerase